MKNAKKTLALAALAVVCLPALAADPIRLKFEGLTLVDPTSAKNRDSVLVDNFYSGGSSKERLAPTVPVKIGGSANDFGVTFTTPGVAVDSRAVGGEGSFGPRYAGSIGPANIIDSLGDSALGFYTGVNETTSVIANVKDGFNDGLSLYYAVRGTGTVQVELFQGIDASEALLGYFDGGLSSTGACPDDNSFCLWAIGSIPLLGGATAHSVRFSRVGIDNALFDNLTFGSLSPIDQVTPPTVPEPGTYALIAVGLAAAGFTARRRRQPR